MDKKELVYCEQCGSELVPSNLDGSVLLDGSTDLSGLKCPKCSAIADDRRD